MSDPESIITGINSPFGSLKLARVSVARAPRNEDPGGRARCFLSSMVGLSVSFPGIWQTCKEVRLISFDSFCLVLRLTRGGKRDGVNEEFKDGASE